MDPNILSLNQLSETLNKAEVLAAEIALIITSIADEQAKSQVLSHASNIAGRPRTTSDLQLRNRPPCLQVVSKSFVNRKRMGEAPPMKLKGFPSSPALTLFEFSQTAGSCRRTKIAEDNRVKSAESIDVPNQSKTDSTKRGE